MTKKYALKNAYILKENPLLKTKGNITEIICTYDPESKSGSGTEASKRKLKEPYTGFSEQQLLSEVTLYDRLFQVSAPDQDKEVDFKTYLIQIH